MKFKTIKLSEENIGEQLCALGVDKDFLNKMEKMLSIKERVDNLDYVRIKNFCPFKDCFQRVKRTPTEEEKVFTTGISDKGLTI